MLDMSDMLGFQRMGVTDWKTLAGGILDMGEVLGFQLLHCPRCDGTTFATLVQLKHRPGGGLVADPSGFACVPCQLPMDTTEALKAYQLKLKREELKQLEDELGVTDAPREEYSLPRENYTVRR